MLLLILNVIYVLLAIGMLADVVAMIGTYDIVFGEIDR